MTLKLVDNVEELKAQNTVKEILEYFLDSVKEEKVILDDYVTNAIVLFNKNDGFGYFIHANRNEDVKNILGMMELAKLELMQSYLSTLNEEDTEL